MRSVKMFIIALVTTIVATVVFWLIASWAGGLDSLGTKAVNGITMITALGLALLAGWGVYRGFVANPISGGIAALAGVANVALLCLAAVVGIKWVVWSWDLLWVFALVGPAVIAAAVVTASASSIYGSSRPSFTPSPAPNPTPVYRPSASPVR